MQIQENDNTINKGSQESNIYYQISGGIYDAMLNAVGAQISTATGVPGGSFQIPRDSWEVKVPNFDGTTTGNTSDGIMSQINEGKVTTYSNKMTEKEFDTAFNEAIMESVKNYSNQTKRRQAGNSYTSYVESLRNSTIGTRPTISAGNEEADESIYSKIQGIVTHVISNHFSQYFNKANGSREMNYESFFRICDEASHTIASRLNNMVNNEIERSVSERIKDEFNLEVEVDNTKKVKPSSRKFTLSGSLSEMLKKEEELERQMAEKEMSKAVYGAEYLDSDLKLYMQERVAERIAMAESHMGPAPTESDVESNDLSDEIF